MGPPVSSLGRGPYGVAVGGGGTEERVRLVADMEKGETRKRSNRATPESGRMGFGGVYALEGAGAAESGDCRSGLLEQPH